MKSSVPLCLCGVLLLGLASAAQVKVNEEAYQRVAGRLICQCGCGQTVGGCNHYQCSSAEGLRKDVRQAITDAPNEERAVESLVQKWGVKLLAEPPRSGFNLTAWVMPFVVLLAGMFLVCRVLWNWRRQTPATAPQTDPQNQVRYAAQIDEELDRS